MRTSSVNLLARCMLWMLGTGLLGLVLIEGLSNRVDSALYDLHMRTWAKTAGDQIVIVAIDSKSLAAIGRWPWPRSMHAQLIDRLTAAGVRSIGLDVTVSEPDAANPANDVQLAQAIKRNGRVVMPVFAEQSDLGGVLEEVMPLPALMQGVAGLGQVDVEQGTARGMYLKAGLGHAYWPSLALTLDRFGQALPDDRLPGLRNPGTGASPYQWIRDDYAMLHYVGPAGSFGRVSYVDVLHGDVPDELLRGHDVLIGTTSEGSGDVITTPVGAMPGVEYQANALWNLQHHALLTPLNFTAQFLLGMAALGIPLLLYPWRMLRRPWLLALTSTLSLALLSLGLLHLAQVWWPPGACLLIVLAGCAGWALFRRLPEPGLEAPTLA